jgi:hypothetical protein
MESMSHETTCFTATVHIDGKPAFRAWNDGQGGSTCFEVRSMKTADQDRKAIREAEQYARTLPPCKDDDFEMPYDLDLLVSDLIEEYRKEQDRKREEQTLRRWCKTKTVIRLANAKPGEYISFGRLPDEKLLAHIAARYPTAEIINNRFA